jgi:hypothetical protein
MAAYIVLGALVFSNLEDWTLSDSIYFSFITLTTVGFGDFVPHPRYKNILLNCTSCYLIISKRPEQNHFIIYYRVQSSDAENLVKLIFTSFYCFTGKLSKLQPIHYLVHFYYFCIK